jgi:hypothetical protein
VQATIQAATGQSNSVPIVIMQPARWGTVSPSRAVGGLVTPVIAPQQLQLCLDHPTAFLFSTPTYFLTPSSDQVHYIGPSYQWLGEYMAETKLNYMLQLPSTALTPKSALLIGNTIVVSLNVVNGPLVFDTALVTEPTLTGSMKGFEVFNSSGAVVPILSAAIGPDGASVILKLGSSPTGGSVAYAWSCPAGAGSGPTAGARGNVRDQNPAQSYYGHPNMYHWAPHFKLNLT